MCRGRAATAITAPTMRRPMRRSSRCARPGKPVRVRWRREEEFGFEPVSPAMVVTVRAALDGAGAPGRLDDRDLERPAHQPPGRRRQPARRRSPAGPAAAAARCRGVGSAGRRHPQRRAALRFPGEADRPSPDRRDAGADLVAARARRDAQRVRDRDRRWTSWPSGPAWTRSPTGSSVLSDPRARAVVEHVAAMSDWQAGTAARHGTRPRHRLRPLQEHGRLRRGRRRGRGR